MNSETLLRQEGFKHKAISHLPDKARRGL